MQGIFTKCEVCNNEKNSLSLLFLSKLWREICKYLRQWLSEYRITFLSLWSQVIPIPPPFLMFSLLYIWHIYMTEIVSKFCFWLKYFILSLKSCHCRSNLRIPDLKQIVLEWNLSCFVFTIYFCRFDEDFIKVDLCQTHIYIGKY